jgi:hypothetical protein
MPDAATTPRLMAKEFLINYKSYTGNSFYERLDSMLNLVDTTINSTLIEGDIQLEVAIEDFDYTTFRWIYTYKGIQAPVKSVALCYNNGSLEYFVDNWDLYTIGSTDFNLSEEDAINKGLNSAKTFSWSIGFDDNTYVVKDFNVTQAMIWDITFGNSPFVDTARDHNPFILYPMIDVWVSLDDFYPGNVYGIEVFYWADTAEIFYMKERTSLLEPSDLELIQSDVNPNVATSATNIMPFSLFTMLILCSITIPAFAIRSMKIKNSIQPKILKITSLLLCALLMLCVLSLPISSANAVNRNALVWGSRSSGSYDSAIGSSWRKTSAEVSTQGTLAASIASMFSTYAGYTSSHNYQGVNSAKSQILTHITNAQNNYPFTAVIDFDHGVGNFYPDSRFFHYMIEDDVGTFIGAKYPGTQVPSNGVYDYEIYANTGGSSQQSKIYFAYISTCMSANLTYQGQDSNGRQTGLPYAWTHRMPFMPNHVAFNTQSHMSNIGYSYPDNGDYCYIGFTMGSPSLEQQNIQSSHPLIVYANFVYYFFANSAGHGYSIRNSLDQTSLSLFGRNFGQTELYNGFTAKWPMYMNGAWQTTSYGINNDKMAIYGNSNMYL